MEQRRKAGGEAAVPTPAERLAKVMEVYGDSYRTAGELCGLDHTTVARVRLGETENPETLAKIAEGYGVPLKWLQGEPVAEVDFRFHVLTRSTDERVRLLWDRQERVRFVLQFLTQYDPRRFSLDSLARELGTDTADLEGLLIGGAGSVNQVAKRLEAVAGIPGTWLECGVLGADDAEDFLPELVGQAIRALGAAVGVECDDRRVNRMLACLE